MYSAQDTNLFLMTTQFFDENSSNFVHLGEWSDPRRDAHHQHLRSQLPGVVDLCEVRHDLGDCQLLNFPTDVRSLVCEWPEDASV